MVHLASKCVGSNLTDSEIILEQAKSFCKTKHVLFPLSPHVFIIILFHKYCLEKTFYTK